MASNGPARFQELKIVATFPAFGLANDSVERNLRMYHVATHQTLMQLTVAVEHALQGVLYVENIY